ncbi:MAG: HAD family hydrolase [Candidatus Doudnabacteria bacterium]|nr:HAD family hydrolase [Candidatus Doudnabacteria bacterium]
MIKAVAFDFRDTLLKVDRGYKAMNRSVWNFVIRKGIKISEKDLLRMNALVIKEHKRKIAKNKKIYDATPIFIAALLKKLGLRLVDKQFHKLLGQVSGSFVRNANLYPDAVRLLKTLKNRKIKTALVIDGSIKREKAIIKRLGLNKFINVVIISEEIGHNKFTSKPLAAALKKLKVNPEHVLVVGDRLDKDIVHANKLGCVSVQLVRHGGRYADLVGTKIAEKPKFIVYSLSQVLPLIK